MLKRNWRKQVFLIGFLILGACSDDPPSENKQKCERQFEKVIKCYADIKEEDTKDYSVYREKTSACDGMIDLDSFIPPDSRAEEVKDEIAGNDGSVFDECNGGRANLSCNLAVSKRLARVLREKVCPEL